MQATMRTTNDGTITLHLDNDAARTVFASVLFAARFHEDVATLVEVATQGLKQTMDSAEVFPPCQ